MFGIKIVTKKVMVELENKAKNQAIADLVELLRKKDKIFLEPVTFDGYSIKNCVFLNIPGTAITISGRKYRG